MQYINISLWKLWCMHTCWRGESEMVDELYTKRAASSSSKLSPPWSPVEVIPWSPSTNSTVSLSSWVITVLPNSHSLQLTQISRISCITQWPYAYDSVLRPIRHLSLYVGSPELMQQHHIHTCNWKNHNNWYMFLCYSSLCTVKLLL